jgi:hypothetical protein
MKKVTLNTVEENLTETIFKHLHGAISLLDTYCRLLTVEVKAAPLHVMQAQRRDRDIEDPIFNLDATGGWVVSATSRLIYPWECDQLSVLPVAG